MPPDLSHDQKTNRRALIVASARRHRRKLQERRYRWAALDRTRKKTKRVVEVPEEPASEPAPTSLAALTEEPKTEFELIDGLGGVGPLDVATPEDAS